MKNEIITTKVTRRTLKLVREIASTTNGKHIAILEEAVERKHLELFPVTSNK